MDSYEKQYENNDTKLIFDESKINSDRKQMIIASDINSVKLMIPFYHHLSENEIAKFSAVVSHFPNEFTSQEKTALWHITMNMVKKSKKYKIINGRLVALL